MKCVRAKHPALQNDFTADAVAQHVLAAQPDEVMSAIVATGYSSSANTPSGALMLVALKKFDLWSNTPTGWHRGGEKWKCRMVECAKSNTANWHVCQNCGALKRGREHA